MTFSETLRNLIEERNLTQKQIALDLSITQSTLGGYVQGTREPDFETLKLLARYFQVTTDYLLGYTVMPEVVSGENDLLRIYRSMDLEQREIYLEIGKVFLKSNRKKKSQNEYKTN